MEIKDKLTGIHHGEPRAIARAISMAEEPGEATAQILAGLNHKRIEKSLTIGITGPPGAGKSTLTNSLIKELRRLNIRVGVIAVDPSSAISGGALLGDRIRMMDHALDRDVVMRSMATRGRLGGLSAAAGSVIRIMAASGCRIIIVETVGTGQSEMDIVHLADLTLMVMAPGFGDDIQAMKAGILEVADLLVINKADKPGTERLMLDLAAWFNKPTKDGAMIFKTSALDNIGIHALLKKIFRLERLYRSQGLLIKKRQRSLQFESIDWAMAILRERLLDCASISLTADHDPHHQALEMIKQLFKRK